MLWIRLIDVTLAFADAFVDLVVDVEVGVNESIRDAIPREKCSFFEHCSKGL